MAYSRAEGFNSRALSKNIIFSAVTFGLNTLISFFITPLITGRFGSDVYGYVKLANDFANYASLFSIALNSMASRFIMLEQTRGNQAKAQQYFSSVGVANILLAAIFILPSALCVLFLDTLFEISPLMVGQVKLTFALTFLNFLIQLIFSIYSNCYYLTNTLYLSSLRTSQASILNAATVLTLFVFFEPRISYVVLGTLAATAFTSIANRRASRRLLPELRCRLADFSPRCVWEVLSSGLWNSINNLGQLLASGLDLLITNVFIGPVEMGYLSIAKTVPNVLISFNATIANAFSPNLMRLYAEGDTEGLKDAAKSAMRFMALFVSIPNAILLSMGVDFYELWVPGQPAAMINLLSLLTIINSCITGPMQPLYQIFTITNKVRENALVMISYGFACILCSYTLLRLTNMGVYAVVTVSLVGSLFVATLYHLPFAAKHIGLPRLEFFPEVLKSILSFVLVSALGLGVNALFDLSASWIGWFAGAIGTALCGFALNFFLLLKAPERRRFYGMVRKALGRAPDGE